MLSQIKLLFKKNFISFLKYIIISFSVIMILGVALEFYNYLNSNYENSVKNVKITMIFSNLVNDSYLNSVSDSLSRKNGINSLEIVTAEKGKEKFLNNFKGIAPELVSINPFPPLINITIKPIFFDTLSIKHLKKELADFDYVEEIKTNDNLIQSLSIIHYQFKQYLIILSYIGLFIIFLLLLISFRVDLINNRKILDKTSKFNFTLIVSTFNLINFLLGIFISIIIFIILWWFAKDIFHLISFLHFKTIIISSMISLIIFIFTSLIAIIFYKDKKFESDS